MLSTVLAFLAAPFMLKPAVAVDVPSPTHKMILRAAASVVRHQGLGKGFLVHPGTNEVCIQGAIFKAATGSALWPRASNPATAVIAHAMRAAEAAAGLGWDLSDKASGIEYASTSLVRWNNAPERTKADVISLLERAAA